MVSVSSIIAARVLPHVVLKNSWIYLCRDNSSISAKPCMRTLLTVEERPWASAGWQYPHQPCTRGSQVIFYYWTGTSIQFTLIFSFNTWEMGLMNSTDWNWINLIFSQLLFIHLGDMHSFFTFMSRGQDLVGLHILLSIIYLIIDRTIHHKYVMLCLFVFLLQLHIHSFNFLLGQQSTNVVDW